MLDEARGRIMLPEFALRAAERGAVGREQHGAGGGGAFVDDDDLLRQSPIPSSVRADPRSSPGEAPPFSSHTMQKERPFRSEEHTSELQSLMRISYAVFFLTKKKHTTS